MPNVRIIFSAAEQGVTRVVNQISNSFNQAQRSIAQLQRSAAQLGNTFRGLGTILNASLRGLNTIGNTMVAPFRALGSVVGTAVSAVTRSIGTIGTAIGGIPSGVNSMVTSLQRGFHQITNTLLTANKAILTFGAAIRQVGQGLLNFGTTFTIFISAPVGALLNSWISEAIDFQDQLTEVRKATGLAWREVNKLGGFLTDLSLETPTSREDLAVMATDWGKLGITAPAAIAKLTKASDMLVQTTDLTADRVVDDLGKLGSIWYGTADGIVPVIENWGSAIRSLADDNAVSENDIVQTALRMAASAKALGFTEAQLLAVAASVGNVSASVERGGTQTASALGQIVKNLEKFAAGMGMTEQQIRDMVNLDAGEFFVNMAASISQIDDRVNRLAATEELFGTVGGKAVGGLAAALPTLADNLDLANREFERGLSLQEEFMRSLDSVKSQIGLLRNNFTYLGATLGDAVLPYLTKLIAIAIPGIQILTEVFKQFDEKTKFTIVGLLALIAIVGPLTIALGSFLFSVGIIITGLGSLVGMVIATISTIGTFTISLLSLLNPLHAIGALIGIISIVAVSIANQLQEANNVVVQYISAAFQWGYNLMTSFGNGILAAASYIYQAVLDVINTFVGLLRAFSPPKEGPLKDIDKWGQNVMAAFIEGMANVDTSPIEDITTQISEVLRGKLLNLDAGSFDLFGDLFTKIKSTISAVGQNLGLAQGEVNAWIKKGADTLVDFLENAENGLTSTLGPIGEMLGGLVGDFEALARAQFEYAKGQERLEEIKKSLEGINDELDAQIMAIQTNTSLTIEQQSAMIRQAKIQSAQRKKALEDEQTATENNLEKMKDEADRTEKLIEILTSLIFPQEQGGGGGGGGDRDKKPKKEKEKKGKELGFDPFEFTTLKDELADVKKTGVDAMEKMSGATEDFMTKIERARLMVQGFLAGLRGDDPKKFGDVGKEFWLGFAAGENIKSIIDDLYTKLKLIKDTVVGGDADKRNLIERISDALPDSVITKLEQYKDAIESIAKGLVLGGGGLVLFAPLFGSVISAAIRGLDATLGIAAAISEIAAATKGYGDVEKFGNALTLIFGQDMSNVAKMLEDMQAIKDFLTTLGFGEGSENDLVSKLPEDGTFGENIIAVIKASLENADWMSIGQVVGMKLGEAVRDAVLQVDFVKLGRIAAGMINFGLSFTTNFIATVSEAMPKLAFEVANLLNRAIIQPFMNFDVSLITKTLTNIIVSLGLFGATLNLVNIGGKIGDIVNAILMGAKALGEPEVLMGLTNLALGIENLLKTVDLNLAAEAVSGFINNILQAMTVAALGNSIGTKAAQLVGAILYALANINWKNVAGQLLGFIQGFSQEIAKPEHWQNLGTALNGIVVALIGAISELAWESEMDAAKETMFANLRSALIKAFTGITWDGHITSDLYGGFVAAVEESLLNITWDDIKNIKWLSLGDAIYNGIKAMYDALVSRLNSLFTFGGMTPWEGPIPDSETMERAGKAVSHGLPSWEETVAQIGAGITQFILNNLPMMGGSVGSPLGGSVPLMSGVNLNSGDSGSQQSNAGGWDQAGQAIATQVLIAMQNFFATNGAQYFAQLNVSFLNWVGLSTATIATNANIYALEIFKGIQKTVSTDSVYTMYYSEYLASFTKWVYKSMAAIKTQAETFARQILIDIQNFVNEKGADYYKSIIDSLEAWVSSSTEQLKNVGQNIAETVMAGINEGFANTSVAAATNVEADKTSTSDSLRSMVGAAQQSQDVIGQITQFAETMVNQLAKDMSTFILGEPTITTIITAITGMLTAVAEMGLELFTLNGYNIATIVRDGMSTFWTIDNIIPVMAAMINSIVAWTAGYMDTILERGMQIAEIIKLGAGATLAEDAEYMTQMLDAINKWIQSNKNSIMELGESFGELLVEGLIGQLRDSVDEVGSAMQSLYEDALGNVDTETESVETSSVSPSAFFPQDNPGFSLGPPTGIIAPKEPENPNNTINFYITINGNADDSVIRKMVDEVERRFANKIKFSGARG